MMEYPTSHLYFLGVGRSLYNKWDIDRIKRVRKAKAKHDSSSYSVIVRVRVVLEN